MKTLKKSKHYLLICVTLILTSCSTDSENDPNNSAPGLFSANALGTGIDTGNVEWTESIDTDDDTVTYAIFLEDQEIASGITGRTYDFSGLEPDTAYSGYVESRDRRGGTSTANFDFLTEPEVIIFTVNASWWIKTQYPEGTGLRTAVRGGFVIPYYEYATSYKIEILDYGFGDTTISEEEIGRTYAWTNESQSTPIGAVLGGQPENENYSAALNGASINTVSQGYEDLINLYESIHGEARVTVIIGN